MSSKYTDAFDSLKADDNIKRERIERILSSRDANANNITVQSGDNCAVNVRRPIFSGRRGVALIMAVVFFFAAAVSIPVGMYLYNNRGLLGAVANLKNTFVDMEGVAAFGVWNAPESGSETATISNVSYIKTPSDSGKSDKITLAADKKDGVISVDWSDEDRYDWESDYDWDPTKANVLIAIGDDGKIDEVVYERTNGRGQVRQDTLGNAAMVYVSDGFTYVSYLNDEGWEWWLKYEYAYSLSGWRGFGCHHEREQTVVIHNETGKVFPLKDIIPQVNEISGATNYTLNVKPFKENYLCVDPMYGNLIPQWYTVVYDEQTEKIRYELMLPKDSDAVKSYYWAYFVRAARRDRYGQQYLLEGYGSKYTDRGTIGLVDMPSYTRYGNSVVFSGNNGMMFGADGRMYVFDEGKLKVFGENFELAPVESGTEVTLEGVSEEMFFRGGKNGNGIAYRLSGGYLFSMFGEVWKVDEDGTLHAREKLEGSFPRYADDGFMLGGEIVAFVDTELTEDGVYSVNGKMVQLNFNCTEDVPGVTVTHIIDASEISTPHHNRLQVEQNENPYSPERGTTKYFLITVKGGIAQAEHYANGYNGGMSGLVKPIIDPIIKFS